MHCVQSLKEFMLDIMYEIPKDDSIRGSDDHGGIYQKEPEDR